MKILKLLFVKVGLAITPCGLAITACGLWMARRGFAAAFPAQVIDKNFTYELVERPVTAVMYGGAIDGHELPGVHVNKTALLIMKDFSTGFSYAYERMDCWRDGKAMYRFSAVVGESMRKWMLDAVEKEGEK
jgi:hypothetical protein